MRPSLQATAHTKVLRRTLRRQVYRRASLVTRRHTGLCSGVRSFLSFTVDKKKTLTFRLPAAPEQIHVWLALQQITSKEKKKSTTISWKTICTIANMPLFETEQSWTVHTRLVSVLFIYWFRLFNFTILLMACGKLAVHSWSSCRDKLVKYSEFAPPGWHKLTLTQLTCWKFSFFFRKRQNNQTLRSDGRRTYMLLFFCSCFVWVSCIKVLFFHKHLVTNCTWY